MVSKIKTASITADAVDNTILDLADNYAFTGTLTGVGFTFETPVTLNSKSSVTFTAIPSGVNIIKFGVWRLSGTATASPQIQIGDSGGIETSGYQGIDVFAATGGASVFGGTTTDSWGPSSWNAPSNVLMLQGEVARVQGNKWTCDGMAQQETPGYFIRFTGHKELSAELTQIKFTLASGSFDDSDSYVQIGYQ